MSEAGERRPAEPARRGYADEELLHLYALGRFWLENGDWRGAAAVFEGLNEVNPDFGPAWLGSCYVQLMNRDAEAAVRSAAQALKAEAGDAVSMLFLVAALLGAGKFSEAGTYLGEVGDLIDSGQVDNPRAVRFYKAQLARYQNRG